MKVRKDKFNRRFPKDRQYTPGEYDIRQKMDAGTPDKPQPDSSSTTLNDVAFRDLSYAMPITVQANPTAEATKGGVPYAIINRTNKVVDAKYPGTNNFAGNTMPQLLNSATSQLLNQFDCATLNILVKYLYAAIRPEDINQALNVQLGKSMTEALSKAYSETFITLPFFNFTIESSMENCDEKNRTQPFIWYQTMLQNIAQVPGKYNLLMSLEQHLKDMCYNRNVAPLDDLFGLLRKNSFRAVIKAFSSMITGEYFDLEWFKQINTLVMVPSRRTNSMTDPLLVIDAVHDIPTIKMKTSSDITVLDSTNYKVTMNGTEYTFQEAIDNIISLLNPYNVLRWARQYTEGIVQVNPTSYFNEIKSWVETVRAIMARFPADVSDIRVVLDVANRSNLNRWTRGVYFDVTREMNYQPVFNKLCHDVFVSYLANANDIKYDDTTLRWRYFSLWDKYLGIPAYDKFNGGSFLAFSTRQFPSDIEPSTSTQYLVPKLFDLAAEGYTSAYAINRLGQECTINYDVISNSDLANDSTYSRLNPLGYGDVQLRVPSIDITTGFASIPATSSALIEVISNLFGLGNIKVSNTNTNKALSSDKICLIDIELDDVSNSMIAYAQTYAPFKVYNPVKTRTIGFSDTPSPVR